MAKAGRKSAFGKVDIRVFAEAYQLYCVGSITKQEFCDRLGVTYHTLNKHMADWIGKIELMLLNGQATWVTPDGKKLKREEWLPYMQNLMKEARGIK